MLHIASDAGSILIPVHVAALDTLTTHVANPYLFEASLLSHPKFDHDDSEFAHLTRPLELRLR